MKLNHRQIVGFLSYKADKETEEIETYIENGDIVIYDNDLAFLHDRHMTNPDRMYKTIHALYGVTAEQLQTYGSIDRYLIEVDPHVCRLPDDQLAYCLTERLFE